LCLAQDLKQTLCKLFAVHENDSLCLFAVFKHFFNELCLLSFVTPEPELLDVVQLQQLVEVIRLWFVIEQACFDLALAFSFELCHSGERLLRLFFGLELDVAPFALFVPFDISLLELAVG
jgi:hypothetical protein